MVEIKRGMRFCQPCHSATYFKCAECSTTQGKEVFKVREGKFGANLNGSEVCEHCLYTKYRKCRGCRAWHAIASGVVTSGNSFYCPPCSENRHFECVFCSHRHETENLWERTPDGPVCRNCEHSYRMERNPPPIADYNFRPRPKFQGKARNGLYYGVELEVDAIKSSSEMDRREVPLGIHEKNEETAAKLRTDVPFIYCKRDGSVPGGFEIVTHPMDIGWIRNNQAAFDPIFKLTKKGYVSHDSGRCGMHVHMSKDGFTRLHLMRFIRFFHENEDFILVVSQRGSKEKLSRWAGVRPGDSSDTPVRMAKNKSMRSERYQAVNLRPPKTVEIRIFRGTLKRERFFKNIEFCQALYEFTLIVSAEQCTLNNFLKFVAVYRKEFPNLYAFLDEKYAFNLVKVGKNPKSRSPKGTPGLRYSGKKTATGDDVSDLEWEALTEAQKTAKEAQIRVNIAKARAAKAMAG